MTLNLRPSRIVCLSDETTETLYLLGEDERIVGISGLTSRPPRAKTEKTIVSGFSNANVDQIVRLQPDLVLTYSDVQADIAAELIRRGCEVHAFNQRSVAGILQMIHTLGRFVGAEQKALELVASLENNLKKQRQRNATRPKVYFEEWNEPLISGIGWVSELIKIAGGDDVFSELASQPKASNRVVTPAEVARRNPDIIIGSWCGKKFQPDLLMGRPDWSRIDAVQHQLVCEIESSIILQPGPAALTDGVAAIRAIVDKWHEVQSDHDSRGAN